MSDRYFDLLYWMTGIIGLGMSGSVALGMLIRCIDRNKEDR